MTSNMSHLAIRSVRQEFPYLDCATYLDNASVSPISARAVAAMADHTRFVAEDPARAHILAEPYYDRGRVLAAKLYGATKERISFVQNTSHGLSLVALGLDWRPGDNIAVHADEFPSNLHCWSQLEALGVTVRKVPGHVGGVTVDAFRQYVDNRTRIVAVSFVQYYSGFRVDISSLADVCRKMGALLVVDGTQAIGALGLDMHAAGVDVLCASAHKWLAGPRGIGFVAWSEKAFEQVKPRIVGWRSVAEPFLFKRTIDFAPDGRRFESGCENGAGMMGLSARLEEIAEFGTRPIEERVLALSTHACQYSEVLGLKPRYRFRGKDRSGIALIEVSNADPDRLVDHLRRQNIHVSVRGGAVRISANYYNDYFEIEHALNAVSECVRFEKMR